MASDRMGNNDVFAVIADKTRRAILTALKDGERPVGELVTELGVSQPTVSKHLKVLREAGMVSMEAQGQRRLYAVAPEPLAAVTDWIQDVVGGAAAPPDRPAGTATTVPVAAEEGSTAPAAAPVPRRAAEPGPELPSGVPPSRPARGAGARAADILSTLSGLRRRGKSTRR